MNSRIIFKIIGKNLLIIFFSFLISSVVALIYSESIFPFVFPSILALSLSFFFHFLSKKDSKNVLIGTKEAYVSVTLSWLILSVIGALPYLISNSIPLFIDAFFESVSGFTTTGSSILTDIESLPKSILFWRSLTHWIGGIGIVLLVIVIMPTLQIGGYQLFVLESSLQNKIQPRIKSVGQRLLLIYVGLTFAEVVLLLLGKMNLFESVCHAFGTIATGGFSPKNDSIAGYSPYIQYVIMVFMLLSGINFTVHYFLFKRQFKRVKTNEEFRFYLKVIGIIGTIITVVLIFEMHKPVEEAFREGFFQVISIITCTGFATADYLSWPVFAWVLIFFSMFFGGSTGSTAGGIKMVRHLIVLNNINRIFRKSLSPNAVVSIRLNENSISDSSNHSILTFVFMYFTIFLSGSMVLIFSGLDFETSMGSVATAMAGIGPGIGTVGQEILVQLREWFHKPIIILSVRNSEEDIVSALDNGANDYLTKPFRTGELLARIRAAIRVGEKNDEVSIFEFGNLLIDTASHVIKKNNELIKLTATEYTLLVLMAKNSGRVLTHQYILKEVWGYGYVEQPQYLRVFVAQLRKKIEDDPSKPKLIITESGIGYRFAE